jgi:hypothetical protein
MVFVTIASIISSTKVAREGKKQHIGIDVRPTSITKYFHMWKGVCTPYKYTRLSFQETTVMFH